MAGRLARHPRHRRPRPPSPDSLRHNRPSSEDKAHRVVTDGSLPSQPEILTMARKSLADILMNSERDRLERSWSTAKAADDLKPIPAGEYRCRDRQRRVVHVEVAARPATSSRSKCSTASTPGGGSGTMSGSREAALAMAKRDLGEARHRAASSNWSGPFPKASSSRRRSRSVATTTARNSTGSSGSMSSAVEPPSPEPFAPTDDDQRRRDEPTRDGFDWRNGEQRGGVPTP